MLSCKAMRGQRVGRMPWLPWVVAALCAVVGLPSACGDGENPSAAGSGAAAAAGGAAAGGTGGQGGAGLSGGALPVVEDVDYQPDPDPDLRNPERGMFYYHLEASDPHTLVGEPLYLGDWCDQDLTYAGHGQVGTSAVLDDYADLLAAHREAGLKVVFRPRYDVSGDTGPNHCGLFQADGEARQYAHVEAVAALLADFVDVIAIIEAGYLGRWGEWNWSGYTPDTTPLLADPALRRAFLDHVVQTYRAAGVERFVGVRRPIFHKEMFDTYPASAPFVAAYNDCFMTDASDYGTYDNAEAGNPSNFASIDEAKQWLEQQTLLVPHGGETCPLSPGPPRWADCANMVGPASEPARLHTVYLHGGWAPDAVATWQAGGCYDEIKRRLGYRYEIDSVVYPPAAESGQLLEVEVRVRNEGWARLQNDRLAYLVLRAGSPAKVVGGELAGYAVVEGQVQGQNLSDWAPGQVATVRFTFVAPEPGAYTLSLLLPDRARPDIVDYAVRVASLRAGQPLWQTDTGDNDLGVAVAVH